MRALVIGGSGQDGILLSAILLERGFRVVSVSRRGTPLAAVENVACDISVEGALDTVVRSHRPDLVFHLAAHHRSSSAPAPGPETEERDCHSVNTRSFSELLESVARHCPGARTLYASSCRIFGEGDGSLLREDSPHAPVCPYGRSKADAMRVADRHVRESGLFVASSIHFNHESELRPPGFVSKKLALAAAAAASGLRGTVEVGSLSAVADWGAARDHVRAMIHILEEGSPGDYIVGGGELRSVADLAAACFSAVGLDWRDHVRESMGGFAGREWRLRGDSSKLRLLTSWRPRYGFEEMARDLVARTQRLSDAGYDPSDFHSHL
jgi:GDPmannose 4,6-dehydratase